MEDKDSFIIYKKKIEDFDLIKNISKIYINGSEWKTNSCGVLKILGKIKNRYGYFLCQFKDGTMVERYYSSIKNGKVENPNMPKVYGVGYIGQGKFNSVKNKKEYQVWVDMLERCCSDKHNIKAPTYKDCTVDKRWHNFQNFCEDIVDLKNYDKWKNNTIPYLWNLDKDIKIDGNKKYFKNTCIFVTQKENSTHSNKKNKITGLTYLGIRINDGYEEQFINQSEFAKKYNLQSKNINNCLKKRHKTHKGWKFEIIKNIGCEY